MGSILSRETSSYFARGRQSRVSVTRGKKLILSVVLHSMWDSVRKLRFRVARLRGFHKAQSQLATVLLTIFAPKFALIVRVSHAGLYLQTVKQLQGGRAYCGRAAECVACALFVGWNVAMLAVLPTWGRRLAWLLLSHAGFMVLHLQVRAPSNHRYCPKYTNSHLSKKI